MHAVTCIYRNVFKIIWGVAPGAQTIRFVISRERSNFISCLCCKSEVAIIHAGPALLERMGLFPGIGRGAAFFPGACHFSSTGPGEASV